MKIIRVNNFIFSITLFITALIFSFSTADSAEKVDLSKIISLAKNNKGLENLKSINDIKITGYKLETIGVKNAFNLISMNEKLLRLDLNLGPIKNLSAINETNSWTKLGNMQSMQIDSFNKFILYIFKYAIFTPFSDFSDITKLKLHKEKVPVSGTECYQISIDEKTDIFVSSKDYNVVKYNCTWDFGREDEVIEMFFEDFAVFNGIRIPKIIYAFTGNKEYRFFVETVTFNNGIDKSEFNRIN